ncbi:DUF1289 domain-containing protein [Tsuneonella litorea]|uniref:DUF1289 domain-containing protein n=1 Tax=Tsuneonella litorea TaxID=2976475 RepID=UPI0035CCECA9
MATPPSPTSLSSESPCTKGCYLGRARRWCTSCGRSASEIGRWADMSDAERQSVNSKLSARLALMKNSSGRSQKH